MNKFIVKTLFLSLFITFLAFPTISLASHKEVLGCKPNYLFSPITGQSCKVIKKVKKEVKVKKTPSKTIWCSGYCFSSNPEA